MPRGRSAIRKGSETIYFKFNLDAKNIYAAVFSDQTVRKIEPNGNITNVYKSEANWAPLHGVFDNDSRLWILEGSDKNDVRVTLAETASMSTGKINKTDSIIFTSIIISCIVMTILLLYLKLRNLNTPLRSLRS